jgi:hypothetical protein
VPKKGEWSVVCADVHVSAEILNWHLFTRLMMN